MESKRLPAQFGLTAKQAFVPLMCVCVCVCALRGYTSILFVGVCVFSYVPFLDKKINEMNPSVD